MESIKSRLGRIDPSKIRLPHQAARDKAAQAAAGNGAATTAANNGAPKKGARNQTAAAGARWEDRELRAQRDRLVEKFTIMQADLGGAFYEMAIRDHVNLEALTRKAAELQKVDQELSEVEQKLATTAKPGTCPSCDAPHEAGVKFCTNCGRALARTDAG
jgi:hypothetical protein